MAALSIHLAGRNNRQREREDRYALIEQGSRLVGARLAVNRPLAAWASDGTVCGNGYFLATGGAIEPAEFYNKYLSPFIAPLI